MECIERIRGLKLFSMLLVQLMQKDVRRVIG
jgi:hypothetical protein